MKKITENLLLKEDASLMDAMTKIGLSSMRILFVVDDEKRLLGTITDGDIRRALIDKRELESDTSCFMCDNPISVNEDYTKNAVIKMMTDENILVIPILKNENNTLIGYESIIDLSKKPEHSNYVLIMAGGFGKRLRPLTEDRPKSMIEFGKMTLLQRQINVMRECNVNDIVVVTGYKADMIDIPGVRYYKNEKFDETNMVETLFCAKEELVGDIIISYADIIYEKNILQKLIESTQKIGVIIDKKWQIYWNKRFENLLDDVESLKIDTKGNIIDIGQKVNNLDEIQGQYIGLMKFNSEGTKILLDFYQKCRERSQKGENPLNQNIEFKKLLPQCEVKGLDVSSYAIKNSKEEVMR